MSRTIYCAACDTTLDAKAAERCRTAFCPARKAVRERPISPNAPAVPVQPPPRLGAPK